ncbi:MAG: hypothetical protein GY761_05880 [Hyphomicrobiales bacterium]|nr:hypothetical protein [Hyphomicrobiales bacterium]
MFGLSTRTWVIGGIVAAIIGTGAIASRFQSHSVEDRVDFATYVITKKLSLNDDQEASLEKLAASWIGTAGSMKTFRKSMINEIKGLTNGEDLSVEQLSVLRDKIKAEIDQKTDAILPELVTFYNGLDKDQRAKIASRMEDISERMEKGNFSHRRGHRHHRWLESD